MIEQIMIFDVRCDNFLFEAATDDYSDEGGC